MEEKIKTDISGAAEKLREIADFLEDGDAFDGAQLTMKIISESGEIFIRLTPEPGTGNDENYEENYDEIIIEDDSELV